MFKYRLKALFPQASFAGVVHVNMWATEIFVWQWDGLFLLNSAAI